MDLSSRDRKEEEEEEGKTFGPFSTFWVLFVLPLPDDLLVHQSVFGDEMSVNNSSH